MNLLDAALEHEGGLRFAAFVAVFLVLTVAERLIPARGDARPARRQASNLGLVFLDTVLLRVGFPLLAVAFAASVHARGGGLFGWLEWPLWIEMVAAVLLLDLAIYAQHRVMHRVPWLWRIHRVHHSDIAFDVTTGVRFHPFEIAFSMAIKLGLVFLLGPHPIAVLVFEMLLSAASLFTHTDVALARRAEGMVRAILVTPSMHRIHHSVLRAETDSNYGFLLSGWDRMFGSYRAAAKADPMLMPIGLERWRDARALGFLQLLRQPFEGERAKGSSSTPAESRKDSNA